MKKAMKLLAFVLAGAMMYTTIPAMAGEAVKSSRDTMIVANILDVGNLDPTQNVSDAGTRVRQWIFEPLFHLSLDTQEYEPLLAESWELEDDTHIIFHLRENVTFHNGNPFTADDVLYSLKHYIEDGQLTPECIKSNVDLDACEVVDDHTFRLAMKEPNAEILMYLGDVNYGSMFDKETMEAGGDMTNNPIGTGPYTYVDYIVGDSVTIQAYPDYWGGEAPVKNVIFRVITEPTQRGIELETGGVDAATNLDVAEVENLKAIGGYNVIEQPGIQVTNVFFNMNEGHPLADVNVRKAVAYAINEEAIVTSGWGGAADACTGVCSPNASEFKAFDDWYNYDPEKAKSLLAEAGYAEGEITLKFAVDDDANRVAMSEVIMNNLSAVGFNVELISGDFASTISLVTDGGHEGWDIFMLKNSKPDALMQLDWANGSQQFVLGDPEFVEFYNQCIQTMDPDKRAEMVNDLQDMFYEKCLYYPMVVQKFYLGTTDQMENVEGYDLMNVNVYKAYFK